MDVPSLRSVSSSRGEEGGREGLDGDCDGSGREGGGRIENVGSGGEETNQDLGR